MLSRSSPNPTVDALAIARELRTQDRIAEVITRSGELGAQLKRLKAVLAENLIRAGGSCYPVSAAAG
jgi:hypothetical protein